MPSAADVQAAIHTCIEGHGVPVHPAADVPATEAASLFVEIAVVSLEQE